MVLVRERALQSDVSTPLMAAGASVKVVSQGGSRCGQWETIPWGCLGLLVTAHSMVA